MRRRVLILGAAAAVAAAAALLWPRGERGAGESEPAAPAPPETFEPVPVAAAGAAGLSLTGVVRDGLGNPIAGAEVALASSAQASLSTVRCSCGEPLLSCPSPRSALQLGALLDQETGHLQPGARARSGDDGRFRFDGLAGVSFTVWASSPRHGPAVHERAAPGDPVELVLPPLRALAGVVTDEAGAPVPGARVRVMPRRLALPVEAETDARGVFEAGRLGEGPFAVHVAADGFLPFVSQSTAIRPEPLRVRLVRPRVLEVEVWRQGARADAQVRLEGDHLAHAAPAKDGLARIGGLWPEEVQLSATAGAFGAPPRRVFLQDSVTRVRLELGAAARLLVTVADRDRRPIPGAQVELFRAGDQEPMASRAAEGGEAIAFAPLSAGDYRLAATARGFMPSALPVQLGEADAEVEVALAPATAIRGRVLDPYGRPAPRIGVLVEPTGAHALSDEAGAFEADVPSPGLYRLSAHHSDFGGGQVEVTAPADGVELQLDPRAGVRVTVTSEGRRVEGADVVLGRKDEPTYRNDRSSGSDGVVLMQGLPPGDWSLVALHPDHLPSDRVQLSLAEGQLLDVAVELRQGAALEGRVVDERGLPIPGASVVASRFSEPVQSDGEGRFALRPLPPGGSYQLRATHPSFDQRVAVSARPGDEGVTIPMRRRGEYRGRVVDERGAPIVSFRVDRQSFESADGRFQVALAEEDGRVMASVNAVGFEPRMIDAPADAPDLGEIELRRLPEIRGVVRDEAGAAVAGASVSCEPCEAHATTGADGRFALPAPGNVASVSVTAERGAASGTATASPKALAPVEIVLRQRARVSGRAFLESGAPAAGVEIDATHTSRGESQTAVTMADGSWSLELAEGIYRFVPPASGGAPARDRAIFAEVKAPETWIDLGPVPGSHSLTVRPPPRKGQLLAVVSGVVRDPARVMDEMGQAPWAQLVFRPTRDVLVHGVPPGRYTVVWLPLGKGAGPIVRAVDVPGAVEVVLGP